MMLWETAIAVGLLVICLLFVMRFFYLGRSLSLLERFNHPNTIPTRIAVEKMVTWLSTLEPKEQFEEVSRIYTSKNQEDVENKVHVLLFLSFMSEAALGYRNDSLHPNVEAFFDVIIPKYYPKLEPFVRIAQEEAARDGLAAFKILDEVYERHFPAVQ